MDQSRLTHFGRALRELGIHMIAVYSPQARRRSERNFGTWQGRLPQELRLAGITTVEESNRKFMVKPRRCSVASPLAAPAVDLQKEHF